MATSAYAVEEAPRNLSQPRQWEELGELLGPVEVVAAATSTDHPLFKTVELPDKDPTRALLAAIGAGATRLLTGDFRRFGPYYGKRIEGVLVLSPGHYLSSRAE